MLINIYMDIVKNCNNLSVSSVRKFWCSLCLTEGDRGCTKKVTLVHRSKAEASLTGEPIHLEGSDLCSGGKESTVRFSHTCFSKHFFLSLKLSSNL